MTLQQPSQHYQTLRLLLRFTKGRRRQRRRCCRHSQPLTLALALLLQLAESLELAQPKRGFTHHDTYFPSRQEFELHKCILRDDLKCVKAALDARKVDADAKDEDGNSALYAACKTGHLAMVQVLLEHHAATGAGVETPLYIASAEGNLPIVTLLLNSGADVNAPSGHANFINLPLTSAVGNDHKDVVKLLLDRGANVNKLARGGSLAPLMLAAQSGDLELTTLLLDRGAAIDLEGEFKRTALKRSISAGHVDIVKLLLDRRANVGLTDTVGIAPLAFAARNGFVDIITLLLEHKANVNQLEKMGETALYVAVKYGQEAAAELLLKSGASVELGVQSSKYSPLMGIAAEDHRHLLNLLLQYQANVNYQSKVQRTALDLAAGQGHVDMVLALLDHKADLELGDEASIRPLMFAAKYGHVKVVETLISRRAVVDQVDQDGATALMIATRADKSSVVSALLDRGAAVNWKNKDGWTPLLVSAATSGMETMQIILERGGDEDINDFGRDRVEHSKGSQTPLMRLAWRRNVEAMVPLLLRYKAQINVANELGDTALVEAARHSQLKTMQVLIQERADVNVVNKEGSTCLWLSTSFNQRDAAKLLMHAGANIYHKQDGRYLWDVTLETATTELIQGVEKKYVRLFKKLEPMLTTRDMEEILEEYFETDWFFIDQPDKAGETMTMKAAKDTRSGLETLSFLLELKADPTYKLEDGTTLLMFAANYSSDRRSVYALRLLLNKGAFVDSKNKEQKTAYDFAQSAGQWVLGLWLKAQENFLHCEDVQCLEEQAKTCTASAPVVVDARLEGGDTVLMKSAKRGKLDMVEYLLQIGANPFLKDKMGRTACELATPEMQDYVEEVLESYSRLFDLFKDSEEKISVENVTVVLDELTAKPYFHTDMLMQDGKPCSFVAVRQQNLEVLEALLERNADVNVRSKEGQTLLMEAAQRGDWLVCKWLLHHNAFLDLRSNADETARSLAMDARQMQVVGLLQAHEDFIGCRTVDCMWAALQPLGKEGGPGHLYVDVRTKDGYTKLMLVANENDVDMVKFVVKQGANIYLKNENRATAEQSARAHFKEAAADFLKDIETRHDLVWTLFSKYAAADAKQLEEEFQTLTELAEVIDLPSKAGDTLSLVAAKEGLAKALAVLLQHGASPNWEDEVGKSLLAHAAEQGHRDCVEALILHGAIIARETDDRTAPSEWAERAGHQELAKLLKDLREPQQLILQTLLWSPSEKRRDGDDWDKLAEVLFADDANIEHLNLVINTENQDGNTIMHLACYLDLEEATDFFTAAYSFAADPNKANKAGQTPLMVATSRQELVLVEFLLNHECDLNYVNEDYLGPIRQVVAAPFLSGLRLFLNRFNPNLDLLYENNQTILFFATTRQAVHLLLDHKPDLLNRVNKFGDTALDVAHGDSAKYALLARGACSWQGCSPWSKLQWAAFSCDAYAAMIALTEPAQNITALTEDGKTVLDLVDKTNATISASECNMTRNVLKVAFDAAREREEAVKEKLDAAKSRTVFVGLLVIATSTGSVASLVLFQHFLSFQRSYGGCGFTMPPLILLAGACAVLCTKTSSPEHLQGSNFVLGVVALVCSLLLLCIGLMAKCCTRVKHHLGRIKRCLTRFQGEAWAWVSVLLNVSLFFSIFVADIKWRLASPNGTIMGGSGLLALTSAMPLISQNNDVVARAVRACTGIAAISLACVQASLPYYQQESALWLLGSFAIATAMPSRPEGLETLRETFGRKSQQGNEVELARMETSKFVANKFVMGTADKAARGLEEALGLTNEDMAQGLVEGLAVIEREIRTSGSQDDIENFEYIIRGQCQSTGRFPTAVEASLGSGKYHGGDIKPGEFDAVPGGEPRHSRSLAEWMETPQVRTAKMKEAEFVAVRLYTSSSFKGFNTPLRLGVKPHPWAMTVYFLDKGIKKLRSVQAEADAAEFANQRTLWRGMKDMNMDLSEFREKGGTELAPMSTTSSEDVARHYAESTCPLLFKYSVSGMRTGVSIQFLSFYPKEEEYLYPPLTYMTLKKTYMDDGTRIIVVKPVMS